MSYEEFEKELYNLAEKDNDSKYAKEGLDFAKNINEIERLYNEGKDVGSAYYILTF